MVKNQFSINDIGVDIILVFKKDKYGRYNSCK